MEDLISRKALLDTLQNHFGQDLAYLGEDLQYCQEAVQFAPSIEAEPVRHGRWDEVWCFDYMDYTHYCSECNYDALTKEGTMHDEVLTSYCPNCGAKMDGGAEG